LNHRAELSGGDRWQFSAYHRRNKDDYAFNRFAPLGQIHPFQHTTWVSGAALDGRSTAGDLALAWRAEWLTDRLESTSLNFGPYRSRSIAKLAVAPEKTFGHATIRGGVTYDYSDRDGSAVSPLAEWTLQDGARRWRLSYARGTQLPTYTALKSNPSGGLFRGNQTLGRESSGQIDASLAQRAGGWSLEATTFWRRDDALVDWTFRRGVTARTANPVDLETAGIEAVAQRSWRACDLVLGYTYLGKNPDYRGAAVDASFYALNYARQRLTAAITVRIGRDFELRMDNSARIQAANFLRVAGGDRAVTSALSIAYRLPGWRGVTLSLQADNLWNSHFQEIPAVPASGRMVSGGVRYRW
jgi:outer membrane cobalamin receptor